MKETFDGVFNGLRVLITGHTGFKGSWLSIWLGELGAQVTGYSLEPPTSPSNFELSHLAGRITDVRGDVRDLAALQQAVREHRPQILFHLAAQPLVRPSYRAPKETIDVNAGGTVNVLEAARTVGGVRAVVCITTDKVYQDQGWTWGYREIDPLGGHDPYSASKAMAELAIDAYRRSFFAPDRYAEHGVAVASARAGNVIGGGDWAEDRLLPDLVRALSSGEQMRLRNPGFVRPWQFLLESLSGYLWLAALLLQEGSRWAEAWNLGPEGHRGVNTEELIREAIALWGSGSYLTGTEQTEVETEVLRLNWDKAAHRLRWRPVYGWKEALAETVAWYKAYHAQKDDAQVDMYDLCAKQIRAYTERARQAGIAWAQRAGSGARNA